MTAVVPAAQADKAVDILRQSGVEAYPIGEIVASDEPIVLC